MTSSPASPTDFVLRGMGVADVVFHELGHQSVDSPTGGQSTESIRTGRVLVEGSKGAFELPDDLLVWLTKSNFSRDLRDIFPLPLIGTWAKAVI
jgi:hypothetical protein